MPSTKNTINGDTSSIYSTDHLSNKNNSSVNIATAILEAQRIVTRRLQQQREKEKVNRQKIYDDNKELLPSSSSSSSPSPSPTKESSKTTTYNYSNNTNHINSYSPHLLSTKTQEVQSDEDENDDIHITPLEEYDNILKQQKLSSTNINGKSKIIVDNNTDIVNGEINYFLKPEPKRNIQKNNNLKKSEIKVNI